MWVSTDTSVLEPAQPETQIRSTVALPPFCWICPSASLVIEICIFLPCPHFTLTFSRLGSRWRPSRRQSRRTQFSLSLVVMMQARRDRCEPPRSNTGSTIDEPQRGDSATGAKPASRAFLVSTTTGCSASPLWVLAIISWVANSRMPWSKLWKASSLSLGRYG
mgnify:CR=1 FL=1